MGQVVLAALGGARRRRATPRQATEGEVESRFDELSDAPTNTAGDRSKSGRAIVEPPPRPEITLASDNPRGSSIKSGSTATRGHVPSVTRGGLRLPVSWRVAEAAWGQFGLPVATPKRAGTSCRQSVPRSLAARVNGRLRANGSPSGTWWAATFQACPG